MGVDVSLEMHAFLSFPLCGIICFMYSDTQRNNPLKCMKFPLVRHPLCRNPAEAHLQQNTWSFLKMNDIWACSHHICQIFYTSTVSGFWKFTQKKRVNRDILNLKYYIFGAFTHSIGVISQFSYVYNIYVHYTYHQWVQHGLILLKTESYYFNSA